MVEFRIVCLMLYLFNGIWLGLIQDWHVDMEPEIREPTLADLTGLFQAHMAKNGCPGSSKNCRVCSAGTSV